MAVKFIDLNYRDVFNKINLEIKANQITSLVGKNGSGKTSFLNLIFGLDLSFDGNIVIGKKNIDKKTKNKELMLVRKNIFYLQQDFSSQLFNINVLEDIKYGLPNLDLNKLYELLKYFNLNGEILNKSYFELSEGEIKKILIIIMLISDNKIILLDDPTNGLDQKSVASLIKLLKKEKRNGKTIIITSQDSEFLLNVSDKIILIENGNLIEMDNKYEFFGNEELINKSDLEMPNVLKFREKVLNKKNIKLVYRDNINDLIKDIYRSAK